MLFPPCTKSAVFSPSLLHFQYKEILFFFFSSCTGPLSFDIIFDSLFNQEIRAVYSTFKTYLETTILVNLVKPCPY